MAIFSINARPKLGLTQFTLPQIFHLAGEWGSSPPQARKTVARPSLFVGDSEVQCSGLEHEFRVLMVQNSKVQNNEVRGWAFSVSFYVYCKCSTTYSSAKWELVESFNWEKNHFSNSSNSSPPAPCTFVDDKLKPPTTTLLFATVWWQRLLKNTSPFSVEDILH